MGRDVADHSVSDASGNGAGGAGAGQRHSQEVSEKLRVFGVHPFQQLFHDNDFSDAIALSRLGLELGAIDRDYAVCGAGLAFAAFWIEAVEEMTALQVENCYAAIISEFEQKHGWHVNLMPNLVLKEFPADWKPRANTKAYGQLKVVVPAPADLFIPKRKRNEPRDRAQETWARAVGLL